MGEPAISSLVGKVVDLLFGVAIKETSYMWNCKENVKKLKNEVENLKVMTGEIQQLIQIANHKGDHLKKGVEGWLKTADDIISNAEEFLQREANANKMCLNIRMCANWSTLYHYGKMASKMAPSLSQHQVNGKSYELSGVSVQTPAPGLLDVYENKDLDDIQTHNSALNNITAAIKDENIQIIGIYGLGGVGKTTLAKEVAVRVKRLFAHVEFITVSQRVDVEKIKKDSEDARKRIMKGDKVLIILDDVWEKLNLEELCIPCGRKYKNSKILLTSRSEKVCQKMNAQSRIYVDSLPTKEAWILFKRVVGEKVETDINLKPVALEVTIECGGLPLLIQAVGNALKGESINSWKAALSRLKKTTALEMDPDINKAFTHLQLSFEYLKSEEAKSCFLLCSMFPEDYTISIEDLVYYMVGLHKFDEFESMEDARDRVQNAVNMLTSSCLLLNTHQEGYTKMHDVVRDVALLIASEGKNKYLVRAGKDLIEWLPTENNPKSYTGISLINNRISKLPDYEVYLSSLDIFLVNNNPELSMISDKFIKGMKEVKVLDMRLCKNAQLPQSLKLLTKLRMLNLAENKSFHDISLLGEMKDLEILILNETGIRIIPQEIGQLVNLRRLELIGCRDMTHVTPSVISKLQSLEELCIDLSRVSEGVKGCTTEVMNLLKLTYLDLKVNSFDLIPEGFNSENLKGFVIQIGDSYRGNELRRSDRYLIISSKHLAIPLLKWLKKLIEVSRPHIFLSKIENLNNIMPTLCDDGFNKLEHIKLEMCSNVSCLVDDSTSSNRDHGKTKEKFFMELKHLELGYLSKLEVIWKCPDEYISLTNLVSLFIDACLKLVRVFTVSVAQGLVNLKELSIVSCDLLEEVICGGKEIHYWVRLGESEEISELQHSSAYSSIIIVFPSLAKISLVNLCCLKSFFNSRNGHCSIIRYPSLVDVKIHDSYKMKTWGPGIHETPNLKRLETDYGESILLDGPCPINDAMERELRRW